LKLGQGGHLSFNQNNQWGLRTSPQESGSPVKGM